MELLKLGLQGPEVKTLQIALTQAGFPVTIDGIFGQATLSAVTKFQAENGLTQDGIVGTQTYSALFGSTQLSGVFGIDISHNNGVIEWDQLDTKIAFVFCKASQGGGFKDPKFANYQAALASRKIIRGAYHFLTFNRTGQNQAANFLACGIDFTAPGMLPPVVDIEWQVGSSQTETNALNQNIKDNRATCIQIAKDWLNEVESKTGRVPIIYTNTAFWKEFFVNPKGFEKYPLWIASYKPTSPSLPSGWDKYTFWQQSGNAKVKGINGEVDTDIFNGNLKELQVMAQLTASAS